MNSPGNLSAFPLPLVANMHARQDEIGLTKRELFAAMAMQGMLSCPQLTGMAADKLAGCAVQAADALIAELAK